MTISPKGFWHLSLPHNLFLGGVPNQQFIPEDLKERGSFKGCVQEVEINGRPLSIMSEAVGGSNVADCPHACTAKPCGTLAKCIPKSDNFECVCSRFNKECNQHIINSQFNITDTQSASQIEEPTESVTTAQQHISSTTTVKTTTSTVNANITSIEVNEAIPQIIPEPPSLINKIEVSVVVPPLDTIEHDFVPHDAVYRGKSTATAHERFNPIKKHSQLQRKSKNSKRRNGVCFSGDESYFHYHDEETKRHIINYNVDLNLRMKTYSANGIILWAGPHTGRGDGDYLMLGIENG